MENLPKILVVCPSIYPDKYKKMRDSFDITSSKNTIIVIQPGFGVTEAINYSFESYPDMDFYFIANDDIIFETPLWDLKLANKGKISYGNDGIQGERLCTFPMIDGDIVRALGWLQLPTLKQYSGDQAWMAIGKILNILEYHPEVLITHKWEGWNEKLGAEDLQRINHWANSTMMDDIEKVRKVCQK